MAANKIVDAHTLRRISVEASRDPRTVLTALAGGGSALSRNAVFMAIGRLGLHLPEGYGVEAMATGIAPSVRA